MIRGIRGAATVEDNAAEEILSATKSLISEIIEKNKVHPEEISHIWITVSPDLNATFPARALRDLEGFDRVPVMCAQEIPVDGALERCIRMMVTAETSLSQAAVQHVYSGEAVRLRPDLVQKS
ncbi:MULTISPECIES: chorismate mutase [Alteribacter]|uniref:chorismate mutase n=1 Tax=Alteribacter keqinensis TaxID=2483800 RepID=A0A3M7TUC7_9BACI|nr:MULTISPECIES: chorismate mutase [Alteribacter]MBM7094649.1 chorismate mutase [Alteribacter salitolerans]RNA69147.1 chorismate mutase [Alteribacter keqinensis]